MNTKPSQPEDDSEKLKALLALLDRLQQSGFVADHDFLNDRHVIRYSAEGHQVRRAIQKIESAYPDLNDFHRLGLWNVFRMFGPVDASTDAATIIAKLENRPS